MNEKLYKNKEWLEKQIIEVGNLHKIGKLCGVSGDTIEYWRKKFNIKHNIIFNRKHKINESFFENIDTEEKAYWLGFIMADGCVTPSQYNKTSRFSLNLSSRDKEHLQKAATAFASNDSITNKKIYDKRNFISDMVELRINSVKFCDNLEKYGIVKNKTGKEYIPDIRNDLKRHFVRGYFDGDGCICKSNKRNYYRVNICSASLLLLTQIQDFFLDNGLPKISIYKRKTKTPFYVMESNSKQNSTKILDLLYKNSNIFLDRKYELFLKASASSISNDRIKNSVN